MPAFPGFIGGSGTTQSLTADGERTVNLYQERMDGEAAANRAALFPAPGFRNWSTVADTGGRGSIVAAGRLFVVMGAALYEFDSNGTATNRGAVAVDANPAQLVYNGLVGGQLGIASGGNAYCFVLATNVLTQVLTGDCTMIAFAAGFGLAFNILTGHVRLSALNDFTTWPPATFFQRSLFGDPYQTMFVDTNNLVWMIGTDTFEVRYNSGTGTQPFIPLSGLVGRYGIAAPFAFGLSGLGNFWLARNPEGVGQFVMTKGASPTAISSYAFDTALAKYLRTSRIDNAEVVTYQQGGHTFANVTLPSPNATWSVDVETQSWTERGTWNSVRGDFDAWPVRTHVQAFGKHLIGDRTTGKISEMDTAYSTEIDGVTGIKRLRRAPALINEHKRIPIDRFEILLDVGLGLASGQGSDPLVMMRFSPDAGRTWGNERIGSSGRMGAYGKRVYWTRFGASSAPTFEVSSTDPVPFRLVNAWLNNESAA